MEKILNIGLNGGVFTPKEYRIRKLYNGITFFGIFTGVVQTTVSLFLDPLAAVLHCFWTLYCILALYIHSKGYFKFAKFTTCLIIMIFATFASARIGSEYYPHIASFGLIGAIFVFFDIREEWGYLLFFTLLHIGAMFLVESDILQSDDVVRDNIKVLRTIMLIGTSIFIALEIITLLRLSWLSEKEINKNLEAANRNLKSMNEEKEVMLQEIHHRVKNNFQVVISLISLQTQAVKNPSTLEIFDQLRMRLVSISTMHEMMYKSKSLNRINFKKYIEDLSMMILEALSVKKEIDLSVRTTVDHFAPQDIVPLALILNELITNSVKHAFTAENLDSRKIHVEFSSVSEGKYVLGYSDNGIWKNDKGKDSGFGLELIELLSGQLDGEMQRETSNKGTFYTFHLNL